MTAKEIKRYRAIKNYEEHPEKWNINNLKACELLRRKVKAQNIVIAELQKELDKAEQTAKELNKAIEYVIYCLKGDDSPTACAALLGLEFICKKEENI